MQSEGRFVTNLPDTSLASNQQPQDTLRAQQWLFKPHCAQLIEAYNPTVNFWAPNFHNQTQQLKLFKKVPEIELKRLSSGEEVGRTEASSWSAILNSANRPPLQPNAQTTTLSHELENTKPTSKHHDKFTSKEASTSGHLNSGGLRLKQKICCIATVQWGSKIVEKRLGCKEKGSGKDLLGPD